MANVYSQAYGYNFFFQILKKGSIDFAELSKTPLGASNCFLKNSAPLANNGTVAVTGTGDTFSIVHTKPAVGQTQAVTTTLALDGTDQAIRLLGLTNAAPQEGEGEETVVTYDDDVKSFETSIATSKSFSWELEGVTDFNDAAYKLLRIAAKESVREGLMIKYARVGPTGQTETTFGFGRFTGFNETPPAGGIVKWSSGIKAYGPYELKF